MWYNSYAEFNKPETEFRKPQSKQITGEEAKECKQVILSAMLFKQGMSSKGILTVARGQKLYRWADIASVKIKTGEFVQVYWYKANGSLILKQIYAKKNVETIRETILANQIKIRD